MFLKVVSTIESYCTYVVVVISLRVVIPEDILLTRNDF